MRTCASICSGGGIAEIGLKRAGYQPIWAIEHKKDIAAVYRRNHGDHCIVGDATTCNYGSLPSPDLLWASPPCPSFSRANNQRGETEDDIAMGEAVIRALTLLRPRAFILENVPEYASDECESYKRICAALLRLDYWSSAEIVNAADFGTPQTRKRLIHRSVAGGFLQQERPFPRKKAWMSWYEAIKDLLRFLPRAAFAPWQFRKLPKNIQSYLLRTNNATLPPTTLIGASGYNGTVVTADAGSPAFGVTANSNQGQLRAFLAEGRNANGGAWRYDDEPAGTVTTSHPPRAFLAPGGNASGFRVRDADEPSFTIGDVGRVGNAPRAWDGGGRVVSITPRPLARFQGVPDSYWLPESNALAIRVVGNGVPVEVACAAGQSVLE